MQLEGDHVRLLSLAATDVVVHVRCEVPAHEVCDDEEVGDIFLQLVLSGQVVRLAGEEVPSRCVQRARSPSARGHSPAEPRLCEARTT